MKLSDSDIIEGVKSGDKRFFDLVFKNYYSGLLSFAKDYLRSQEAAQEIIQDLFLFLWENKEKVQIKTSLKAYLYRSVHNRCLTFLRDSASQNRLQFDHIKGNANLLIEEISETVFDRAFAEHAEKELEETIESLPEQCRKIFRLNRYEKLTYPQIAEKLGISLSTVKTQMSRAMNTLYEKMKKYL